MKKLNQTLRRSQFRAVARTVGFILISVSLLGNKPLWSQDKNEDRIDAAMQAINPSISSPFPIDQERVRDNGIDVYQGKHIVLYTDLRDEKRSLELVAAFDAAIPQWCHRFRIDPEKAKSWKMRVFLIASTTDVSRFEKAGLTPDLPSFEAGFQRDHNFWFFAQPGSYYTRHLMLHEGTHAFMQWFTGGYGAPWYSEGNAELIGLHQWRISDEKNPGQLTLGYRLRDRSEAEYWGRVSLIQRDKLKRQAMSIQEMLNIPANAFRDVRNYAWSWAGCEFFSNHRLTQDAFQRLRSLTTLEAVAFNEQFGKLLQDQKVDWRRIEDDWTLFIDEIDYGYSVARGAISEIKASGETQFQVDSGRAWQFSKLAVKKGQRIRIAAKGRFEIGKLAVKPTGKNSDAGDQTQRYDIQSEANGVTLFYYRGRPLGELQMGIWNPDADNSQLRTEGLVQFEPVGLQKLIEIDRDGVLCFRINESPAKLADNQGALEVNVERLK